MAEINIDCVDGVLIKNDEAMRVFRQNMPHALPVCSVENMVASIEQRLGSNTGNKIRRLRVFGHGMSGRQGVGLSLYMLGPKSMSHLTIQMAGNQLQYENVLARLHGRFASGGWVELHGCEVGQGEPGKNLTKALAQLWGVNVAAGTVIQHPSAGFETRYIVARPDGHVSEHTGNYRLTPSERAMMDTGILILVTLANQTSGLTYMLRRIVEQVGGR